MAFELSTWTETNMCIFHLRFKTMWVYHMGHDGLSNRGLGHFSYFGMTFCLIGTISKLPPKVKIQLKKWEFEPSSYICIVCSMPNIVIEPVYEISSQTSVK